MITEYVKPVEADGYRYWWKISVMTGHPHHHVYKPVIYKDRIVWVYVQSGPAAEINRMQAWHYLRRYVPDEDDPVIIRDMMTVSLCAITS